MVLLFCIFHHQVATAAGLNITTEYCHIVWVSYNCYRCHFPEGRNFLRFFAKSPHPTVQRIDLEALTSRNDVCTLQLSRNKTKLSNYKPMVVTTQMSLQHET